MTSKNVRLAKRLIHLAKVLQGPRVGFPPGGINPGALPLWKHIMTTYCDVIFQNPKSEAQWGRSIRIFERACQAHNIKPWK